MMYILQQYRIHMDIGSSKNHLGIYQQSVAHIRVEKAAVAQTRDFLSTLALSSWNNSSHLL